VELYNLGRAPAGGERRDAAGGERRAAAAGVRILATGENEIELDDVQDLDKPVSTAPPRLV
jgi:hypothetical protein